MTHKTYTLLACGLLAVVSAHRADAAVLFARGTASFTRGDTTVGLSPTFYGSDNSSNPLLLTQGQARLAVIGGPDGAYVSLPGQNDTPQGADFPYAYVELTYPTTFIAQGTTLDIFEYGAEGEQALLSLWVSSGGVIQVNADVRSAPFGFHIDLSYLQQILDTFGPGAAFTKIGIGGLDIIGESPGFDLDTIVVTTTVPEPATGLLIAFALAAGAPARLGCRVRAWAGGSGKRGL